MNRSDPEYQAILGIADAYYEVGCTNRDGSSAFYDMGIALVIGKDHSARIEASDNYKENNPQ